MKNVALVLIGLAFFSCRSVSKTEISGTYKPIRPTYPELARYVITDWVKGYWVGRETLIFQQNDSFARLDHKQDTTVTGSWQTIGGNKVQTTINWNDSIYNKSYSLKGNKFYTITILYSCEDTAMTRPRKMLSVYQKVKQ